MEINPFAGKNLRCIYDEIERKWWFSAVDICGILINGDYESARKYWKAAKNNFTAKENQLVANCNQLKMPAKNGKYYYTEVMDIRQAIYFIQIIPSPHAEPYRLWLANAVANHTHVEPLLIEAGAHNAAQIRQAYINDASKLSERLTIKIERLV
ncbi:MAG: hypothetical protein FWC71_05610 [Defluviitaleaceae bacterium]|nr:hypothetical protein [Defluviitaleaceae bacterium]